MCDLNRKFFVAAYCIFQFIFAVLLCICVWIEFYLGVAVMSIAMLVCFFRIRKLSKLEDDSNVFQPYHDYEEDQNDNRNNRR